MKHSAFLAALILCTSIARAEVTLPVFDHASFYDGYLVERIPEDAPDEGYLRLYTYLNATPLSDALLDRLGETLTLDVTIHAFCDNYDRIGSVNLAFLPKGTASYAVEYKDTDPMRIEIARFITPFMDKNKTPDEVPYSFRIDNLSRVLRNKDIRAAYDVWMELEVFGVPYAANNEIQGCAGCNHVFDGSVALVTDDTPAGEDLTSVFVPVVTRRSDWRADRGMNNYNEACTDELGRTIKTYKFTVPTDVQSGRIVIMMSNHGAGTKGEEYTRRMHYAYFDGASALEWKPGRTTCEPYRQFNTQANGIYGYRAMTDARWQSFSNWCPGAAIPYQTFATGALTAGEHSITIEVPDAVFYKSDGFFPVSIYFQGDTEGAEIYAPVDADSMPASIGSVLNDDYITTAEIDGSDIIVGAPDGIDYVQIFTREGRLVAYEEGFNLNRTARVSVDRLPTGVYILVIATPTRTEARKIAI